MGLQQSIIIYYHLAIIKSLDFVFKLHNKIMTFYYCWEVYTLWIKDRNPKERPSMKAKSNEDSHTELIWKDFQW